MGAAANRAARGAVIAGFAALVALALVTGIAGGLLRAGVALHVAPELSATAALGHAALMIGAFLGTVIGIERAVALKHRLAFVAPLASALAGVLTLARQPAAAAAAFVVASVVFVLVNVAIVRRQAAAHTALLLCGAVTWLAGNVLLALGWTGLPVIAWWFAFVILTIAAERLEMTRLLRQRRGSRIALFGIVACLALGAALSPPAQVAGGIVYGAALVALAIWLALFDIARRTVRTQGLSRYMAICLLGGYAWLAVAGGAWIATALGFPARDAALHALGIGFILAMVMAHAPVILPAVTGIKVRFSPVFYLPLAVLHASLVLRLAAAEVQRAGAVLNALAILLFALTMIAAAIRARAQQRPRIAEVS